MVIRENIKESIDLELGLTKAAAWAWYERGSWFEHKSIRETDSRKTSDYTRKPSRYKLEAMKTQENETHDQSQPRVNRGSLLRKEGVVEKTTGLLDKYEIERISKEIDWYVEGSVDVNNYHRRKSVDGGDRRVVVSLPELSTKASKRESKNKSKSISKSEKQRKGFWMGRPMSCGSSGNDVMNSSLVIRRRKEDVVVSGVMDFRRPIIHYSSFSK